MLLQQYFIMIRERERGREREREQNNIAATILHSHCCVYTFTGQNICHRCFHSHGYYRCFYSQGKASVTAVFPFTGQNVCHLCVSIHRTKRLSPLYRHSRCRRSVTAVEVECCFTSTETVGLLGTGAQDGHLDFHPAHELSQPCLQLQLSRQGADNQACLPYDYSYSADSFCHV